MSTALAVPIAAEPEQRIVLERLDWQTYLSISDALADRPGLRMIYLHGSLVLLTTSRRHDWHAEHLGYLVAAVAAGLGLSCEVAGQSTYRLEDRSTGVEGDKTFYFGEHADLMRGPVDIDLSTQPPPDLAIEVEVTHRADDALAAWGRIGTPEVWRFDANSGILTILHRREDGTFAKAERSLAIPVLGEADVLGQLQLADELGFSRWLAQLADWVRDVLVPRGL